MPFAAVNDVEDCFYRKTDVIAVMCTGRYCRRHVSVALGIPELWHTRSHVNSWSEARRLPGTVAMVVLVKRPAI